MEPRGRGRERADIADLERHMLQASTGPVPPAPSSGGMVSRTRSRSWCDAEARILASPDLRQQRLLREPGGFRRDFLHARAGEQGLEIPERPAAWGTRLLRQISDQYWQLDEEQVVSREAYLFGLDQWGDDLWRDCAEGGATQPCPHTLSKCGIAFVIFKANCGCAVLYQPRAWRNGGLVLSAAAFPTVAVVSILCAARLLHARMVAGGRLNLVGAEEGRKLSYGDLMEQALGPQGRTAINTSIVLLQSGTCCSYFIVIGSLMQSVCFRTVPLQRLIVAQLLIMLPLATVRKVAKLWPLNLLGTVLVIAGIMIVMCEEGQQLVSAGPAKGIEAANFEDFFVCLGTACFMFEGIGLVLPVYESSREPATFPRLYCAVMCATAMMVITVGCLGYLAYGDGVDSLILLNLPAGGLQAFVRLAFVVQVVCSFPLQLLPAVRLVEDLFFRPMSNPPLARKCWKSCFRAAYVVFLAMVSVGASTSLDNFVSLIGAVCGVPLAFVFPAICHFHIAARGVPAQRLCDACLAAGGVVLALAVSWVNIAAWARQVGS